MLVRRVGNSTLSCLCTEHIHLPPKTSCVKFSSFDQQSKTSPVTKCESAALVSRYTLHTNRKENDYENQDAAFCRHDRLRSNFRQLGKRGRKSSKTSHCKSQRNDR